MEYQKIVDAIKDQKNLDSKIKMILLEVNPDNYHENEIKNILDILQLERPQLHKEMTLDATTNYM